MVSCWTMSALISLVVAMKCAAVLLKQSSEAMLGNRFESSAICCTMKFPLC